METSGKGLQQVWCRHIYLCSGIGKERMIEIVNEQFDRGVEHFTCHRCGKSCDFFNGHVCKGK